MYIGLHIKDEDAKIILDGPKNVWFADSLGHVLDQLVTMMLSEIEKENKNE